MKALKILFLWGITSFSLNAQYLRISEKDENDHSRFRIDFPILDSYTQRKNLEYANDFLDGLSYLTINQSYALHSSFKSLYFRNLYPYVFAKFIPNMSVKTKLP